MSGDKVTQKQKVFWYQKLWNLFSDYCERSTIHGIRYIGEKNSYWTERIWWLISCVISFITSAYFIHIVYLRWMHTPVLITFAAEATSVSDISFRTITIAVT